MGGKCKKMRMKGRETFGMKQERRMEGRKERGDGEKDRERRDKTKKETE